MPGADCTGSHKDCVTRDKIIIRESPCSEGKPPDYNALFVSKPRRLLCNRILGVMSSMKVFHCDHCGSLLFFENDHCVSCGHLLAYVCELGVVTSLDPIENDLWTSPLPRAEGKTYRLCKNYKE